MSRSVSGHRSSLLFECRADFPSRDFLPGPLVEVVQCELDEKLDKADFKGVLDTPIDDVGNDNDRGSCYYTPGKTFQDTADVGFFMYGFTHEVSACDKYVKI